MRGAARILVLVPLAPLAIGLSACGDAGSKTSGGKSGEALYQSQGCTVCHGADGSGTSFGPTLLGKKAFWTRDTLVQYLKNPVEYAAKVPRLLEQSKRFTLPMLRFDKLPDEELSALADFVLGLP